ncbi:hypothetical protein BACPU_01890 [Bacillus pumilus]|nr:hypothetical protein BACPU_01890 [Bacillus pumilus]
MKKFIKYVVVILFFSVFFYYYNMFMPKNFLYFIVAFPIGFFAINIIDKLFSDK